ncbi:MAG: Ppx/GppA phosphatase family protein [Alphaproteobacteria bacterium]
MSSVAVIDLGTHNCRMTIADISTTDFKRRRVYSKIVRLGEGTSKNHRLSASAMHRTLTVLKRMADIIHEEQVKDIYPLATESARIAENSKEFFRKVKAQTNLNFKIISAQEEARLSVLASAPLMGHLKEALIFDIGGGSTEVILVERTSNNLKVVDWLSMPFGVVRGRDRFGATLKPDQYALLATEVEDALKPFFKKNQAFQKNPYAVIGSSGTVTTLAACALELFKYNPQVVDGCHLGVEKILHFASMAATTPLFSRKFNPVIGRGRAEYLPSGCAILHGLFRHISSDQLIAADRGLREGIFYSLIPSTPKVVFKGKGKS